MPQWGDYAFGYIFLLNGYLVGAGAIGGPRCFSAKEAKLSAILGTLKRACLLDFDWIALFSDAQDIAEAIMKEKTIW